MSDAASRRRAGLGIWILLSSVLAAVPAAAQPASLVKEINPNFSAASSAPYYFADLDGVAIFGATDADGNELWRSDGTRAGTSKIKDIFPGSSSSYPERMFRWRGHVYFSASDGVRGYELWRTDGTAEGTVLFKDLIPGAVGLSPSLFTPAGDFLYFKAYDASANNTLWRTDGTEAGTVRLATFPYIDANQPSLALLTEMGGRLYFRAHDGVRGWEPWTSDGTPEGTRLVADINPGAASSSPGPFCALNGQVLFGANDGVAGQELWAADGTAAGTRLVADLRASGSSSPTMLGSDFGVCFFSADDGVVGRELWKTDGTAAGTVRIKDLTAGAASSRFDAFVRFQGKAWITVVDPNLNSTLWASDGTEAGTVARFSGHHWDLTVVGSNLFFDGPNGFNNNELWKTDGVTFGLLKEIRPGTPSSNPRGLTKVGNRLFLSADNGTHGQEPWISDGTVDGTVLLKDVFVGQFSGNPQSMATLGGLALFSADDGINGAELWKSDGTAAGTTLVRNIAAGATGSSPTKLTVAGPKAYFVANDGSTGAELWRTDGTTAGTVHLGDLLPGSQSSVPDNLTAVGATLFFTADGMSSGLATNSGQELWKATSTTWPTLVKNIRPFYSSSSPASLVDFNGTLFFSADDGTNGRLLWRSDGTPEGTVPALGTGCPCSPGELAVLGGTLYFAAFDAANGVELWKTDGTRAGTALVRDIRPGTTSSTPTSLKAVAGALYFLADDGTSGVELWKSDGTAAGTVRVADLNPGPASPGITSLTPADGRLYFIANDGVRGGELWVSDGTPAGTRLVDDIAPGAASSSPAALADVNGTVFFQANNGIDGAELWAADDITGRAALVQDINPGPASSNPTQFRVVGGRVLFAARAETGTELWALQNAPPLANAGPDRSSPEGQPVTLNGSASSDPDGPTLAFRWKNAAGEVVSRSVSPSMNLPVGVHVFTLDVSDGLGGRSSDTVTVTIEDVAHLALDVASEGGGFGAVHVSPPDEMCTGAAGGAMHCEYGYAPNAPVTLSAIPSATSAFAGWAGGCAGTEPTCSMTLASDVQVTALFRPRNRRPLAQAGGPYTGFRNQSITFNGAGSTDPDGDALSYAWDFGDGLAGGGVSPTHGYATLGTFAVNLIVSDGILASESSGASVTIVNRDPVADAGVDRTLDPDVAATLDGAGSTDPDQDALTYEWRDATEAVLANTAVASVNVPVGAHTFTLVVSDGQGGSANDTVTLTRSAGLSIAVSGLEGGRGFVDGGYPDFSCHNMGEDPAPTCLFARPPHETVTLHATPQEPSVFERWEGACTGTAPTCEIAMDDHRAVAAVFRGPQPVQVDVTGIEAGGGVVQGFSEPFFCVNPGEPTTTCTQAFRSGTVLTLMAIPNQTSVFEGWVGACTGLDPTCTLTVTDDTVVGARFHGPQTLSLDIVGTDSGAGLVWGQPAFYCFNALGVPATSCRQAFPIGTVVTLTASPSEPLSAFTGWTGACAGTEPTCTLTIADETTVGASFRGPQPLTLEVAGIDSGSGTIADVGTFSCNDACTNLYKPGTIVTLTVFVSPDSVFLEWTGACSGSAPTCTVTMDQARTVGARLHGPQSLRVEMLSEESGTGTVQLDPPGFVCSGPDPCVFPSYLMGTRVTLTAHPSADSLFVRWGGACAGNGACEVTLSDDVVVRATFGIRNHPPVANAGGPRAGYRNVPVLFDGSSSSDPDGDALTYHWDFGDGATAAGASVTHAYAALGTFDVTLTVSDGNGATSNASTTAVIANRAPVAAAGPDQVVALGQGVTLSAAGSSDPDSDALSYEWRSAGGPVGTTPTVILSLGLGSHDITLTVRDGAGGEASDAVRVVVADTAPPIVVVTAPDGAPVTQGLPYTITWTATDNGAIAGFDVALSTNGGVTFNPLAGCTALAGAARSCVWSSPGPVGASTRLRVTGRDASGNAGSDDSAFPIQAPAIVVTAPNGAQSWGVGSVQRVAWTHNLGAGSLVRVELSRNGGSSWTTIAPSVTNATATAGFFDWTVTGATTTNARVRVVWQANTAINDRSDASFTIASPFVTVTSPNTGVAWTVGTVQTLRWNHNLGTNGVVKVEVSRDGGGAWALIHSGVANNGASTGSFDWTVSGPTTTKGRIRLTWTADPAVTDRSDANFTIR